MGNPIVYWRDWWNRLSVVEQTVAILFLVGAVTLLLATPAGAQVTTADPSNNAVYIALIAMVPVALVTPFIAFMNERSRRKDRAEDLAERAGIAKHAEETSDRQAAAANKAELAAKDAASAAKTVAVQATEAARLLEVNQKTVASTAAETHAQLQTIHALVNSNMTSEMQANLNSTIALLAVMQEVIDLKKVAGHPPSDDAIAAIGATKGKIAELEVALADRLRQSKEIEKLQNEKAIALLKKDI